MHGRALERRRRRHERRGALLPRDRRRARVARPHRRLLRAAPGVHRGARRTRPARGVRVRVLVPARNIDKPPVARRRRRAAYDELRRGRACERRTSTARRMLRRRRRCASTAAWSSVGSANFDNRSFQLHDEATAVRAPPMRRRATMTREPLDARRRSRLAEPLAALGDRDARPSQRGRDRAARRQRAQRAPRRTPAAPRRCRSAPAVSHRGGRAAARTSLSAIEIAPQRQTTPGEPAAAVARGESARIAGSIRAARRPPRRSGGAIALRRPARVPHEPALVELLGELDRVRRGALEQVVRDHPHLQPALVRRVAAQAADEHVVAAGGAGGGRVGVDRASRPGHRREQRARLLDLERLARLQVDRLRVRGDDRHAGAGDGDRDRLVAEDLARLEHHLALFVGVVVAVGEVAGAAEDVERDRVRIDLGRGGSPCPCRSACVWSSSSSTASTPVPDTDW